MDWQVHAAATGAGILAKIETDVNGRTLARQQSSGLSTNLGNQNEMIFADNEQFYADKTWQVVSDWVDV